MESIFLFAGVFGFFTCIITFTFDFFIKSPRYKGRVSDHFDGKEFYSIGKGYRIKENIPAENLFSFLKWQIMKPRNNWKCRPNKVHVKPEKMISGKRIFVTFVNHSTVLIQTEGLNILTDPVWSKTVSPFFFLGPKRYSDPGVRFEDLPKIDVVLLSHNHYDHMDLKTLRRLYKRDKPRIFAPLGNSHYLAIKGIPGAVDMDWWDKNNISPEIKLVSVPAQHFSSRAITDRNKSLWCGYVLETSRGPIYFAGDTAYGQFKEKIKEKYSKFILGFVPVAAYKPEWIMGPVHISPYDAFHLRKELNIETTIGIHFGTFKLTDDGQDEGPNIIKDLVKKSIPEKADFRILENGQTVMI